MIRNCQINTDSLFRDSRTKQVDDFTARLLEIHAEMMAVNKKEVIN
jgi:glutathione synthase